MSQVAGPSRKRVSRVQVSDSEDEAPRPVDTRKRRKTTPESESNSDLDELASDDERHTKSQIKRRLNGQANGQTNGHSDGVNGVGGDHGGDEEDIDDIAGQSAQVAFRPEYERDPRDGFVAGSVTRIKCRGFMTYDHVEFRPGPHLNMILGPNGTGKSTIAAAIAIGLGFPPKVMGRASDLKSYVKQGTEQAETEIELKAKRGKKNVIIKRRFQRDDDKSEWFLNGASSTKKAVVDTVESMGIQANNLCSFLPQDKVAEFAKMAPITVLRETMRAAGDPRLTKWHDTLIEKGLKLRKISADLENDHQKRENLQNDVARLEPDVEHYLQRAQQEREREILELLVICAERNQAINQKNEAKVARREAQNSLNAALARRRPLSALQTRQQELEQKVMVKVNDSEEKLKRSEAPLRKIQERYRNVDAAVKKADQDLDSVKAQIKLKEHKTQIQKEKIRQAQNILDQPREEIQREHNAKLKEKRILETKDREQRLILNKFEVEERECNEQARKWNADLDVRTRHLEQLSSLEKQKELYARDLDPSVGGLIDWLAVPENAMRLEGTVHKPIIMSANVREKGLAAQIEQCTNWTQRKAFICENENDYNLLVSLLGHLVVPASRKQNGVMIPAQKLKADIFYVEVSEASVNPPRPCTPQQLARLGFEGFAIDYMDAEPGVMAFLNMICNLHTAAVTRRPGRDIDSDAAASAGISRWTTSTDSNRAVRSIYGNNEYQITSFPMPPRGAQAFNKIVDTAAIKAISDEIADIKQRQRIQEKPNVERKKRMQKSKEEHDAIKTELIEVAQEVNRLANENKKFYKAQADLDTATAELQRLEDEPSLDERRTALKNAKLRVTKKYMEPVRGFTNLLESTCEALDTTIELQLKALQTQVNLSAVEAKLRSGDDGLTTYQEELRRMHQVYDQVEVIVQETTARMKQKARAIGQELTAAAQVRVDAQEIGTPEEVMNQLQDVIAALELSAGVDPAVVSRYERLKGELEDCTDIVKRGEKTQTTLRNQVATILDKFNPALDSLVGVVSEEFSKAFEEIGCSGEVRLDRVEGDFSQWGIQILVSYRDGENLSILTGSRQSGGERSLATVTYLMSLSKMARTPFSLVDEINQGMDQRAERNVHGQLVNVTCGESAGQYFLITPKLLTGLKYHPRMKVLIVNNGKWLPDSTDKNQRFGDLAACLKRYERSIAA